jgi:serine/threonine-protein kinase
MNRTLAGQYRLTTPVAHGAAGTVWRGVDHGTDRTVAIKVLHPDLVADGRLVDLLRRARPALSALWHPGIARLLDLVVTDRAVCLVTAFAPGTDLAHLMASGPLPPAQAVEIGAAIAEALDAAHRADVVHGDLRPTNVIVATETWSAVTLTDFMLANLVRVARPQERWAADTSPYLPPWAIDGGMPTSSTDVHALGIILCEMLTGSTSPEDVGATIDPELQEVIYACTNGDYAATPTAAGVAYRLRELAMRRGPDLEWDPPHASGRRPRLRPSSDRLPEVYRHEPQVPAVRSRNSHGGAPLRRRGSAGVALAAGAAVLAVVIGTIAVVSLQGNPVPPPAQETSPNPPSVGAPSPPAEATAASREGAIAFVEYWFAALTHAVRTGETETFRETVSPECADCQQAFEAIESAYAGGGSMRGGAYVVRRVTTTDLFSEDRVVYVAVVDRSDRASVDAAGETQAALPGISFESCSLVLQFADGRWLVREVVTPGCVE